MTIPSLSFCSRSLRCLALGMTALLAGCASVGPDFRSPESPVPSDWQSRPSSARALSGSLAVSADALPEDWWRVFGDATLDALQARAADASPDLQTAVLRFAQSRLQRRMTASQSAPQVDFSAQAVRQRQSDQSAEMRLVNALSGSNRAALVKVLTDPFTLYQAGFNVSWELDFWGHVQRQVEAADAQVEAAGAQLQDARLVLASELARAYFELRQLQRQQTLLAREAAIAEELLALQQASAANGLTDHDPVLAQTGNLASLRARQSALEAQAAALVNQIGLLTGDGPGVLNAILAPAVAGLDDDAAPVLPALKLGQAADLLRRRPDVRAVEARLHAATAGIGVAVADLYPRISLGASAGYQSISSGAFGDWGTRTWQVGPVLNLPIFDRGRRKANVELRRQDQQAAAIAWRQSVLKAWQEVDDALNEHAAERVRNRNLRDRAAASREQLAFARARAANGLVSQMPPLQAELAWRQAQSDLSESDTRLRTSLVKIYKAVGGGMPVPEDASGPSTRN